jgi:hypothetical protein
MNSPERINAKDIQVVMPKDSKRFDLPVPSTHQFYVLWAIQSSGENSSVADTKLFIQICKEDDNNQSTVVGGGILSPANTSFDFSLDMTMPKHIPHFNLKDGKITLIHDGIKPTGIIMSGEFEVHHISVGTHSYTFNW